MNAQTQQWIKELAHELEIIQSHDINKEAKANMNTFSMPRDISKTYTNDELSEFIVNSKRIYQAKNNNQSMSFYAWFDEQAGH